MAARDFASRSFQRSDLFRFTVLSLDQTRSGVLSCPRDAPLVTLLSASTLAVSAQKSPAPSRVRGTIEAVDGDVLAVKSRSGEAVNLHKVGAKLIALAKPRPDGSFEASRSSAGHHGLTL